MNRLILSSFFIIIAFTGCGAIVQDDKVDGRWYTNEQVTLGKEVFINNCAVCHGAKAEKTIDWKTKLADGSYPPPPLNDKAHAWHHPKWQLMKIINEGGAAYGGKMPPFEKVLKQEEKKAAIAYFQSFWSDEIYELWNVRLKGLEEKK